ncbi:MAG: ECF transporter S component [Lachnospiraceae bacterium]|nr:ECF transporter S component [Lachnospiraceae bacterium]MBR5738834.1 ECF transporter S component [Lachnospiraceae bacterium]
MSKKKGWILRITYDGLLAALCAVLGSVAAIDIGIAKLTFENVPVVIAGLLFGPVDGMLVGFVGIFLSQVIRYGIDASTMLWVAPYVLSGLVVGLGALLCRFRPKFWQLLTILIVDAIVVTGSNTVGLYIYYYYILRTPKETMFAAIPVRLAVSAVKGVLYAILMPLLIKGLESAGIYERPRVQGPNEDRETPQDEGTDTP